MASEPLDDLRDINRRLAEFLERTGHEAGGAAERIPGADDIQFVSNLIRRGGALLEAGRAESEPEWRAQANEYYENLRRVKEAIGKLQSRLSQRKGNLRTGGAQLRVLAEWIETLKGTR